MVKPGAEHSLHWSWTQVLTDPVRLAVLRGLCELGEVTIAELSRGCHTSDSTVRRHLDALVALGLVRERPGERDGLTPGRPASSFVLDPDAAARACALFEVLREPLLPSPEPAPPPPAGR